MSSIRRCCSSSRPDRRAELRSLDAAIAGGEARQDLARAAFKPRLLLGAEAGIQGDDYGFSEDERYALASVILRWNAFRGGADRAALREARAFTDELRATRDLAAQRVRLEVQQAVEDLEVADASLDTALKRAEAADGALRIATRKRDLGQINQAEFIDARRTMTDARLNLNRVRAEFLVAHRRTRIRRRRPARRGQGAAPMRRVTLAATLVAAALLAACGEAPAPDSDVHRRPRRHRCAPRPAESVARHRRGARGRPARAARRDAAVLQGRRRHRRAWTWTSATACRPARCSPC